MKKRTRIYLRIIIVWSIIFCLIYVCRPRNTYAENKDPIGDAKNGIVEIFSGFSDREGTFWQMKSGSGFLISNTEGTTYIVTNSSILQNSDAEKISYCEANGIDTDSFSVTDAIRVVVKGDVTVEASVITQSENMDFCILSTENAINEKVPLKLGDSTLLTTGDSVYALGFSDDTDDLKFQEADVEIFQGSVQDKESNQSGIRYIQHSAIISEGNTGGPILNTEGYVVGINCSEYSSFGTGRYYSLPVNELAEILNNFGIDYGSREKDLLKKDLNELQQECIQLNESGRYKKNSLTELQTALLEMEKLSESENPAIQEMREVYQHLTQGKDALVPKKEKIQIAIYVLAVLIVLLLFFLIRILLLSRQDKKSEISAENHEKELKNNQEPPVDGEVQHVTKAEREAGLEASWGIEGSEEKTVGLSSYRRNFSAGQGEQDKFLQKSKELEILRKSTGQVVKVDKPEYLIGKSQNQADLFISDNKAVSRRHATIVWKNNEYFICDLGSVNGTYVKGKKIPDNIPVKLSDGDVLEFADEAFLIKIFDI